MKHYGILLLSLVLLAGCGANGSPTSNEPVRPALVQKVVASAGAAGNAFSGEVRARHEADMGFRIAGKIIARDVDVGAVVKAGQPLAHLDPADAALQARQAEAQRALAEADLRRYRELRAKNFVSPALLESKETEFRAADAQAGLARNQSAYAVLRADKAGVITAVNAEPGQVVTVGQAVMRLAQLDEPEVVINVPESRLKDLRDATQVVVVLWSAPDKRYEGRVREIAPAADAATRTFTVKVSVLHPDADVKLGMTANVLLGGGAADFVAVPLAAVTRLDSGAVVWVLDVAKNTVSPRTVTVAAYGETGATVTSGLVAGDTVVVAGVHKLRPGQQVRPVPADTAS